MSWRSRFYRERNHVGDAEAEAMKNRRTQENRSIRGIVAVVFLFFLGAGLFLNLQGLQKGFLFADEATYHAMTRSLLQDGDLEYTRRDLARYYTEFESGPMGIFLKKGKSGKIFFAKSLAYSLAAVPFVGLFGVNGYFVLHACLLFLLLWMGLAYLRLHNPSALALGWILTFLCGSVAIVYFFWISPDFLGMSLVTAVLFLWLFKHSAGESAAETRTPGYKFLFSEATDYLAAGLAGLAVYIKPPNIVLLIPLVLFPLYKKRWIKAFFIVLVFAGSSGVFWGLNHAVTGDWNYQGGERKIFYRDYPLQQEGYTFDSLGWEMTSENYEQKHRVSPRVVLSNFFYYFFGRTTGLTWYFFPAVLALGLFLFRPKTFLAWLLFAAIALEILIYVILMPDNYAGGGGALSNRYFLNIYPFFFFLPGLKRRFRDLSLCWLAAALFLSPVLVNPIRHSHFPASHLKKLPFSLLPVELSLVNNISTNTDPQAFRIPVGAPPGAAYLHHLDDNYFPKSEGGEIWTKGGSTAEMILETLYPIESVTVHLAGNGRPRNPVWVKMDGERKSLILDAHGTGSLTFKPGGGFTLRQSHLYLLKIRSSKESIPYFEEAGNQDKRPLGVRFRFEIVPRLAEKSFEAP